VEKTETDVGTATYSVTVYVTHSLWVDDQTDVVTATVMTV
jgi:hypothetical protein